MKDCSIGTILSHKQQSNSSMENSLFENISGKGGEGWTDRLIIGDDRIGTVF
jgi:hypothetical protein